jgi:hypothetical protein
MMANLARPTGDATSLPLVLQYNKRDLADAVPVAAMDRALNGRHLPAIPAIAVRGDGVLETFSSVLTLLVTDLARRYKLTDLGRGQGVEEWAQAAVQEIFGTSSLPSSKGAASVPTAAADRRTVRMALPADVSSAERLDARTNEALVESYAQVAAALGEGSQAIREERDLAQQRLDDVLAVLEAARGAKTGAARESVPAVMLTCLAREVEAPSASLLVPAPNQSMKAVALHRLAKDPILSHGEGSLRLRSFLQNAAPRWHEADDPALQPILSAAQPPHGSVVSVPLAVGQETPIGLALLYRAPAAPPPRRESLKHLGDLARILAPFLDSTPASGGGDKDAETRELLGTAFRLAGPRLLQSLRDLRQKLADLRRRPDSPVWLPGALAEIAPGLAEAASIGRSLSSLDSGALEDEPVDLGALLARLGPGIQVEIGRGVKMVKLDPALFGLALEALVERARQKPGAAGVEVRCAAREGRVTLRVGGRSAAGPPRGADPALLFATRVVEMHGGSVSEESDPAQGSWTVLDVAAG